MPDQYSTLITNVQKIKIEPTSVMIQRVPGDPAPAELRVMLTSATTQKTVRGDTDSRVSVTSFLYVRLCLIIHC